MPDASLVMALSRKVSRDPRLVIIPALPGSSAEALAGRLVESVASGRVIVLPVPEPTPVDWHADTWHALSPSERRLIRVIAGPTAAHLTRLVKPQKEVIAVVDEPLVAIAGLFRRSDHVRKDARQLRALQRDTEGDGPSDEPVPTAVNPQSRMLLAPWYNTETLRAFPAKDEAEEWRERLARVEDSVKLFPSGDTVAAANFAAASIGTTVPPLAAAAAQRRRGRLRGARRALLEASWLDAALHERAVYSSAKRATGDKPASGGPSTVKVGFATAPDPT